MNEFIDLNVACCQAAIASKPMFHPVIYDDINRRISLEEITEPNEILDASHNFNQSKFGSNDVALRPHYVTFKYHNACPDGLKPFSLFFNEKGESDLDTRYLQFGMA